MTDYHLTDICGFEPAAQNLYGGKEKRGAWIDALQESGGNDAVSAAVAEQAVSAVIQVIREGGILENQTVVFYRSRYDSSTCLIFNYLMRQYQVDVPLRTQGRIKEKLSSAIIQDGKRENLRYLRYKNCRGSQKFFECMNALIRAVTQQSPDQAA